MLWPIVFAISDFFLIHRYFLNPRLVKNRERTIHSQIRSMKVCADIQSHWSTAVKENRFRPTEWVHFGDENLGISPRGKPMPCFSRRLRQTVWKNRPHTGSHTDACFVHGACGPESSLRRHIFHPWVLTLNSHHTHIHNLKSSDASRAVIVQARQPWWLPARQHSCINYWTNDMMCVLVRPLEMLESVG